MAHTRTPDARATYRERQHARRERQEARRMARQDKRLRLSAHSAI